MFVMKLFLFFVGIPILVFLAVHVRSILLLLLTLCAVGWIYFLVHLVNSVFGLTFFGVIVFLILLFISVKIALFIPTLPSRDVTVEYDFEKVDRNQ